MEEMNEEKWKELEKKYETPIDPSKYEVIQVREYVRFKIHTYEKASLKDFDLWFTFREDFEQFSADSYRNLPTSQRQNLRLFLLGRGVYIANYGIRGITIGAVLRSVIDEEEPHIWTDFELSTALKEIGRPMMSGNLRDRLSHDHTRLASEELEHSEHSFDPNNAFLASPQSRPQPSSKLQPDQPIPQAQAQAQAQQPTSIQEQILAVFNQLLQNQQRPPPPPQQLHAGAHPLTQDPQQFQPRPQRQSGREYPQSGREYPQYGEPSRYGERPQPRENEFRQEPIAGPLYTREITTIGKIYKDDQKYDGIGDSFDFKLSIFYDICRRCGLPVTVHHVIALAINQMMSGPRFV
jgi:hypothetical protein